TTPGAFQRSLGFFRDGFAAKLDRTGSALLYSTHLGAADGISGAFDAALDARGRLHVVGSTNAPSFPTTPDAFQRTKAGGSDAADGFVARLDPRGSSLVFSSFLGGAGAEELGEDSAVAVAVDALGATVVGGRTTSVTFPTTRRALQPTNPGCAADVPP